MAQRHIRLKASMEERKCDGTIDRKGSRHICAYATQNGFVTHHKDKSYIGPMLQSHSKRVADGYYGAVTNRLNYSHIHNTSKNRCESNNYPYCFLSRDGLKTSRGKLR